LILLCDKTKFSNKIIKRLFETRKINLKEATLYGQKSIIALKNKTKNKN